MPLIYKILISFMIMCFAGYHLHLSLKFIYTPLENIRDTHLGIILICLTGVLFAELILVWCF